MFPTGQQYWRPKMATSILRLGRLGSLKSFQSQSWIIWRNRSVASFCTQAEEPPKKPKKTKTTSKTATPDERASLLAYRTAVIFPVKVSETPSFPGHSVGVAAAAAAAAGSGTAASAEPRVDPQTAEFSSSSSKPADEAVGGSSSYSSSSSSSDSESDSDSDSDDELSQAKTHISEPTIKHESGDGNVTSKLKDDPEESRGEYDRGSAGETPMPEVCSDGAQGAAAGAESGAPAGAEEPGNSPESLEVTESPAGPAVSAEDVSTTSPLAENSTDVPAGIKGSTSVGSPKTPAVEHGEAAGGLGTEVPDSAGAEASDGAGAEAAEVLEGSSTPADADVKPTEAGDSVASSSTESSELMEAAPVRAESEGEELQPEEAAAPVPPEPEEPLDISTYKNYQHHSYHPFTFADMDVEMAKYRLPQPTADRH